MLSLNCQCRFIIVTSPIMLPTIKQFDIKQASDKTHSENTTPKFTSSTDKRTITIDLGKNIYVARIKIKLDKNQDTLKNATVSLLTDDKKYVFHGQIVSDKNTYVFTFDDDKENNKNDKKDDDDKEHGKNDKKDDDDKKSDYDDDKEFSSILAKAPAPGPLADSNLCSSSYSFAGTSTTPTPATTPSTTTPSTTTPATTPATTPSTTTPATTTPVTTTPVTTPSTTLDPTTFTPVFTTVSTPIGEQSPAPAPTTSVSTPIGEQSPAPAPTVTPPVALDPTTFTPVFTAPISPSPQAPVPTQDPKTDKKQVSPTPTSPKPSPSPETPTTPTNPGNDNDVSNKNTIIIIIVIVVVVVLIVLSIVSGFFMGGNKPNAALVASLNTPPRQPQYSPSPWMASNSLQVPMSRNNMLGNNVLGNRGTGQLPPIRGYPRQLPQSTWIQNPTSSSYATNVTSRSGTPTLVAPTTSFTSTRQYSR